MIDRILCYVGTGYPWGKDRVVGCNEHCYVLLSQICFSRASVDFISSERDRVTLHIHSIRF